MSEGTKHSLYKKAVADYILGKLITIQNKISFAIVECRTEKDTLFRKGSKSRRHDIVALTLPFPATLWGNPKPIMDLPGGREGAKLAAHLISHGARDGSTLTEIASRHMAGESVGSRLKGKTMEEESPRCQLIIEIRDTNAKTEEHKEEIRKGLFFAVELDIRSCPDEPNDGIVAKLIEDAQWIVEPIDFSKLSTNQRMELIENTPWMKEIWIGNSPVVVFRREPRRDTDDKETGEYIHRVFVKLASIGERDLLYCYGGQWQFNTSYIGSGGPEPLKWGPFMHNELHKLADHIKPSLEGWIAACNEAGEGSLEHEDHYFLMGNRDNPEWVKYQP